jgi:hypothetical protein
MHRNVRLLRFREKLVYFTRLFKFNHVSPKSLFLIESVNCSLQIHGYLCPNLPQFLGISYLYDDYKIQHLAPLPSAVS